MRDLLAFLEAADIPAKYVAMIVAGIPLIVYVLRIITALFPTPKPDDTTPFGLFLRALRIIFLDVGTNTNADDTRGNPQN